MSSTVEQTPEEVAARQAEAEASSTARDAFRRAFAQQVLVESTKANLAWLREHPGQIMGERMKTVLERNANLLFMRQLAQKLQDQFQVCFAELMPMLEKGDDRDDDSGDGNASAEMPFPVLGVIRLEGKELDEKEKRQIEHETAQLVGYMTASFDRFLMATMMLTLTKSRAEADPKPGQVIQLVRDITAEYEKQASDATLALKSLNEEYASLVKRPCAAWTCIGTCGTEIKGDLDEEQWELFCPCEARKFVCRDCFQSSDKTEEEWYHAFGRGHSVKRRNRVSKGLEEVMDMMRRGQFLRHLLGSSFKYRILKACESFGLATLCDVLKVLCSNQYAREPDEKTIVVAKVND